MNVYQVGFALVGFLGLVAVVPAGVYFTTSHPAVSTLPIEVQFLAGLVLPAMAVLFLASWVQPG